MNFWTVSRMTSLIKKLLFICKNGDNMQMNANHKGKANWSNFSLWILKIIMISKNNNKIEIFLKKKRKSILLKNFIYELSTDFEYMIFLWLKVSKIKVLILKSYFEEFSQSCFTSSSKLVLIIVVQDQERNCLHNKYLRIDTHKNCQQFSG